MRKHWRNARLLALWHGGKPAQYLPELMRQGAAFRWYDVSGVKLCLLLLAADIELACEVWKVL